MYTHDDTIVKIQNWKPIEKLFYGKYANVVRTPDSSIDAILLKYKGEYRLVSRGYHTRTHSVYTNNVDLVNDIVNDCVLESIETPLNQMHYDLLADKTRDIIYREKPYYNKYHNRVETYRNWGSAEITVDEFVEINKAMYELFESSESYWSGKEWRKKLYTDVDWVTRSYHYGRFWHSYLPTIYTNDETALMMFKLRYNDRLRIKIKTIVTTETLT